MLKWQTLKRCSRAEDDKGRCGRHHSKYGQSQSDFTIELSAARVTDSSRAGAGVIRGLERQTLERCSRVEEADVGALLTC